MLDTEISNLNKKWQAMDKERNDSVCMFTYYATIVLETILILLLIFSLLGLLYSYFETGIRKYIIEFLGSSTIFALISTLRGNIGTFYIFSPIIKYNEKRLEQIKYWDTQNPEYIDLKQNIKKLNLEKQELIEKKINLD